MELLESVGPRPRQARYLSVTSREEVLTSRLVRALTIRLRSQTILSVTEGVV